MIVSDAKYLALKKGTIVSTALSIEVLEMDNSKEIAVIKNLITGNVHTISYAFLKEMINMLFLMPEFLHITTNDDSTIQNTTA